MSESSILNHGIRYIINNTSSDSVSSLSSHSSPFRSRIRYQNRHFLAMQSNNQTEPTGVGEGDGNPVIAVVQVAGRENHCPNTGDEIRF